MCARFPAHGIVLFEWQPSTAHDTGLNNFAVRLPELGTEEAEMSDAPRFKLVGAAKTTACRVVAAREREFHRSMRSRMKTSVDILRERDALDARVRELEKVLAATHAEIDDALRHPQRHHETLRRVATLVARARAGG